MIPYNQEPQSIITIENKEIAIFSSLGKNIDEKTVNSFGNEWSKFSKFSNEEIQSIGDEYFDIITPEMLNQNTAALDVGCGTGRWTKYVASRAKFVESIDPSDAIYSAAKLLKDNTNVRLAKASTDNLPFEDESFDFVYSLGVLHHIPDTEKAMIDCVKKVKYGGYFMVYLYYNLDNRNIFYKLLFYLSNFLRQIISKFPKHLKFFICDLIAIFVYMPFVLFARFLSLTPLRKKIKHIPLSYYVNKSFKVIRNDALDRFGTPLEQRFSKQEILKMMKNAGLENIIFFKSTTLLACSRQKN